MKLWHSWPQTACPYKGSLQLVSPTGRRCSPHHCLHGSQKPRILLTSSTHQSLCHAIHSLPCRLQFLPYSPPQGTQQSRCPLALPQPAPWWWRQPSHQVPIPFPLHTGYPPLHHRWPHSCRTTHLPWWLQTLVKHLHSLRFTTFTGTATIWWLWATFHLRGG